MVFQLLSSKGQRVYSNMALKPEKSNYVCKNYLFLSFQSFLAHNFEFLKPLFFLFLIFLISSLKNTFKKQTYNGIGHFVHTNQFIQCKIGDQN